MNLNTNILNTKLISVKQLTLMVYRLCYKLFIDSFKPILSIFNNDAHDIVSKKSWEILNKKQ